MKKLATAILTLIISHSLFATSIELHSDEYLPENMKIEVTINKVELAPFLNDYNTFYFGDDDFEMFLSINGNRQIEFPLKANTSNKNKVVEVEHKFKIDINDLNLAVERRRDSTNLSEIEIRNLNRSRTGQLCMLDDSLISPAFISTSYYGCFDLVNEVQKMIEYKSLVKDIYVEKNTTFPVSNDPAKAKLFKSWYTIKIIK